MPLLIDWILWVCLACITDSLQFASKPVATKWVESLPKFNSRDELGKSPSWSKYLSQLYGTELIDVDFPLDLASFDIFYPEYLDAAGLVDYPRQQSDGVKVLNYTYIREQKERMGLNFVSMKAGDVFQTPANGCWPFPGKAIRVYRPKHRIIKNSSKVEVVHGQCQDGRLEPHYWMYALRGSGIFYDVGRTVAFPIHVPMDTLDNGRYDSVQFFNFSEHGFFKYEVVDLRTINPPSSMSTVCPLTPSAYFHKGRVCKCDAQHKTQMLNCVN